MYKRGRVKIYSDEDAGMDTSASPGSSVALVYISSGGCAGPISFRSGRRHLEPQAHLLAIKSLVACLTATSRCNNSIEICPVSLFAVAEFLDRIWRASSWCVASTLGRSRTRRRIYSRTVCRGMTAQVALRATYQSRAPLVYVQPSRLISSDLPGAIKKESVGKSEQKRCMRQVSHKAHALFM